MRVYRVTEIKRKNKLTSNDTFLVVAQDTLEAGRLAEERVTPTWSVAKIELVGELRQPNG